MKQVDQQRAAAQEASANDEALLVGLREQLEAAHAEESIAICQREAQPQRRVMDLQHEVHYLNNQLNPILDGEEDGPNMEKDEEEDKEEVEPEEGDDPISDLDSDHDED